MEADRPKVVVAVGVMDPSGCGGLAADLRTLAAMGVHGSAVVSGAWTSYDDRRECFPAPAELIARQIESSLESTGAGVVKIGGLPNAESVQSAAQALRRAPVSKVVLDPDLTHPEDDLKDALKSELLPITEVVTVSMPEASALLGIPVKNSLALRAAGKLLARAGAANVLAKGAHVAGDECVDVLWDGNDYLEYPSDRIDSAHDEGAGCVLASAIAAGLAHGRDPAEAIAIAKMYVTETLRNSYPVGAEGGSPSQLYQWWNMGGRDGYGG